MHNKSQEQAAEKAVIHLGTSNVTARLTFVCLSRAKRLVDLLAEPIPLVRLSKVGKKTALNPWRRASKPWRL